MTANDKLRAEFEAWFDQQWIEGTTDTLNLCEDVAWEAYQVARAIQQEIEKP